MKITKIDVFPIGMPYAKPYDENGSFKGLQTVDRSTFEKLVRGLN